MFNKIKLPHIIYSAVALITAVLIIALPIWAAAGASITQINVVEGEVILSEDGVRDEYLVGQSIDSTGVSLKVGKDVYTTDELEFTVDNASAGTKMVEVSHREDNNYYRGYYPVTYFAIRHLDMHKTPSGIKFDDDGNVTVEGMELWAELSGQPTSFDQPDDPGLDTVIILDESNYTLEIDAPDESGGYFAKIACGKHSVTIYFIEINGEMIILESANRLAVFTNENGTGESLTLYITSRGVDDSANGKINVAEGFFIYRDENGVQRYQFDYYMSNTNWGSYFNSVDIPAEMYRRSTDDALIVQFGDLIFSTPRTSWCLTILDNPNP